MKKFITAVLALAMCAAMSTTAFAAAGNESGLGLGNKDIDVNAKYSDGTITQDVYSVDMTWGAMEFTYSASGTRTWDADTHTYTENLTAGWSESGNTVAITNHSNKAVNATFAFTKLPAITESITGAFTYTKADVNNTVTLAAGVENKPNEADSVTATLTLSGALDASRTTSTKVGTIKVTLA